MVRDPGTVEWVNKARRLLGLGTERTSTDDTAPPRKQVRFAPVPEEIPRPKKGVGIRPGRPRSGAVIEPPPIPSRAQEFTTEGGKKISIAQLPGGKVVYTAPPPPVREITFSGGGGKGVALPGAVRALEEGGVLAEATKVAGASVGSMTAALVAAGIKAKDFERIANDRATTEEIVEGTGGTKKGLALRALSNLWNTGSGNPLTGGGLESVVARVLDETLRERIEEYEFGCKLAHEDPDPVVGEVTLALATRGPTFGDLRKLSKVIPAIKEVVITGTYTTEFDLVGIGSEEGEVWKEDKSGNDRGQLYVFDADSEPDLEVAVAVHASASFPAAFKPVDITLSSGKRVRFIDGGVMNNTPTSSSIANERKLDPMPESRGITFVFEDSGGTSKGLLEGKVKPSVGLGARVIDWFLDSDHSGAEYAKNRDMTDRPEEIVVVPLKIDIPGKKGKKGKVDMRGGTLEFNLEPEKALALQVATAKATSEQIEREKRPRTREFESDSQMFVSIGMSELRALARQGYPKADAALDFRNKVAEMIDKLADMLKTALGEGKPSSSLLADKNALLALRELNQLAGSDIDFQGYVGREMNRGRLDTLIDAMRKKPPKEGALGAVMIVEEALRARSFADNILKQLVYPKMKQQNEKGAGIETLLVVEGLLRAANSAAEVNEALDIAIAHFANKSDRRLPKRGHKAFAADLSRRKMPIAA